MRNTPAEHMCKSCRPSKDGKMLPKDPHKKEIWEVKISDEDRPSNGLKYWVRSFNPDWPYEHFDANPPRTEAGPHKARPSWAERHRQMVT